MTRVVFLCALADNATIHAAIAAGAAGFLPKDSDQRTICDALVAVARGETVLASE